MSLAEGNSPPAPSTLRAIVSGRVQGVGYRYFVVQRASALGVAGRVWNRADGAVEVEARGDRALLERLIGKLREGPTFSRVADVEVDWDPDLPPLDGFDVRY